MRKATLTGLATLGVALVAAAVGPRAWAQSVVVGPQANSVSASHNGLITVPVVANLAGSGGASLGSIAARLTWRPAILAFRGFTLGTAGAPVASADSATGILRFAVANAGGLTGTPVLINAQFEAMGVAGDTTNLNLAVDEITAAGTFANLLSITSVTSSRFCVAGGRLGDLDNSDAVTSFDALLIVTSAVGLPIAPNTTVNGDVDGNGKVDTRDALIVLSFAVGLPTAPYEVGVLNTFGCTLRSPISVAITPAAVGVAVGDRFPLAATTRDSVNAIISSGAVTWTSRDPLIATVDAFGSVLGVGAGSTRVVAMVTPTVMDSATVTVTGSRHVWYVNPAVAAGNPVELGSQAYPFSTMPQGVAAAAPGDTVRIAVATYGGTLLIRKPLVVIGDSDATGFPRLRNPTGPAVLVDTAGTVRISRLRIEDSQGGVSAVGDDTLDLRAIIVERSRGVGISVLSSAGVVTLRGVSVAGAQASALQVVGAQQVTIVGGDFIGAQPNAGLLTPGRPDDYAVALALPGTATVRFDSSVIHDNGIFGLLVTGPASAAMRELAVERGPGGLGQPVVNFSGVGSVRLAQSHFAANGYGAVLIADTPGGGATASVDTSTFDETNLRVRGPASFAMRGGQVLNGDFVPVYVDSAGVVSLVGIEIASTIASGIASVIEGPPLATSGGPWAVMVVTADSLRADSLWIHDNLAGALGALLVTAVSAYGNRVEANDLSYGAYEVKLYQTQRARIAQSVFDDRAGYAQFSLDVEYGLAGGGRVVVDTSTFWNPSYGVYATGADVAYNDTLVVRGSVMRPGDGASLIYDAVVATSVGYVAALGNTLDSAYYTGVDVAYSGSAQVRDNVIRYMQLGTNVYSAGLDTVSGNTFECTPGETSQGIVLSYTSSVVTANTVRTCGTGIHVVNTETVTLDSNVVVDGTGNGVQIDDLEGMTVTGGWNFVARNKRGFYGNNGTVTIDSSTIQGNTFRGVEGVGGWNFANNYWGDANGPRALPPGDTLVTAGDSAIGVIFSPWLLTAPAGAPIGAPPAFRLASARIAAVGAAPLRTVAGATRAVRAWRALPPRSGSPAAAEARRRMAEEQLARLARIRAAGVRARP